MFGIESLQKKLGGKILIKFYDKFKTGIVSFSKEKYQLQPGEIGPGILLLPDNENEINYFVVTIDEQTKQINRFLEFGNLRTIIENSNFDPTEINLTDLM